MTRRTPTLMYALGLTAAAAACLPSAAFSQPLNPQPAAPRGGGAIAPGGGAGAAARPGANPPAARAGAEPPPSVEEIKQLASEGKHREALQKLSRALALKGDAAAQYDRHELLRLKAEAHLNIRDTAAAASAFAAAAKEAPDDAARAEDKAAELVVRRSKNLQFTPKPAKKGEKAEPINIADPETRKAAFAALLEEEKAAAGPMLKSAAKAKSLPPIVEGLRRVGDLRMLELAATGADDEATKLVEDLGEQAHELMDDAVQDMAGLVDAIETSANEVQRTGVAGHSPVSGRPMLYPSARRRGLTSRDAQDLKRTINDLKKLVPTARELAEVLGDEQGKSFEKVADDGETVGNRAQKVLTTDYGNDERGEGLRRPMEVPRR